MMFDDLAHFQKKYGIGINSILAYFAVWFRLNLIRILIERIVAHNSARVTNVLARLTNCIGGDNVTYILRAQCWLMLYARRTYASCRHKRPYRSFRCRRQNEMGHLRYEKRDKFLEADMVPIVNLNKISRAVILGSDTTHLSRSEADVHLHTGWLST